MKQNDILYCKKDFYLLNNKVNIKGKYYKILKVYKIFNAIYIESEINSNIFNIKNSKKDPNYQDYFITLKEYRKLKILKLNENN